jgi:hypothetical protein
MENTLNENEKNIFIGFWDSHNNATISDLQKTQIILWAKSILFFHDNSIINFYTKINIIPPGLIDIKGLNIIYSNNFKELFQNTPLENYNYDNKLSKCELSDIIRISLLYKYGGTWLDIDDIVIRKFPNKRNILGSFLWKNNKTQASYWGSTFNLCDASIISNKYSEFGFHIQNDPMINWEKGNKFLYEWMTLIKNNKSCDWGQKIPTDMIRNNNIIIQEYNITLLPQHYLLLHPAFGNNKQFGYPNNKGPMFPPYDLRITGKVNYDDMINKDEFWKIAEQTLIKHEYCCIKNSKNIGINQHNEGKENKWFIGHIANITNIDNILQKFNDINNNNLNNNNLNIMIVAHPDDELFFGWKELIKQTNWFIICITNGNNKKRNDYFKKVMNILKLNYIIYNFPDNWRNPKWDETIQNDIKNIINTNLDKHINYNKLITHNPHGEYGHYHHRMISKIVNLLLQDRNEKDKLYFFNFDDKYYKELPDIYNKCLKVYFEKMNQKETITVNGMKELSKISYIIKASEYIDKTIYNSKFFGEEFLNSIIIKYT